MKSRIMKEEMVLKKFGLLLAGGLAVVIFLATIGPMIALLISLVMLYFIYKQFLKTESTGWKIGLFIIGMIVLAASIHNIPALIGALAAYVLVLVYKNWNKTKKATERKGTDPFENFEKQWNELKKL